MPTGYTIELDENGFDSKKWVTESVVRAFGICVAFRERGKMSKEEILRALEKNANSPYYEKELKKAIAKAEELNFMSGERWEAMMQEANAKRMEFYKEREKEHKDIREGHVKVKTALLNLLAEDISEVTRNIVEFGLEQLDLVEGEYKEDFLPILSESVQQYKKATLKEAHKDIRYYRKEMVEEKKRETERLKIYKQVLEDCEVLEGRKGARIDERDE